MKQMNVKMLGVPLDLGAGRRGVDMGPSAVRLAGVSDQIRALGHQFTDTGNIFVPSPENIAPEPAHARYLHEIRGVCDDLRQRTIQVLEEGAVPLVIGGDHSIAMGSVSGVAEFYRRRQESIGLIWVDAHADMNTPESSPSGNVHGMPLAALLGMGAPELVELGGFSPKVDRRNVCLIGIRNLDKKEKELVHDSGIHAYTMRDVDERGIVEITQEAIGFACEGTAGFHVSFDLDGMDPTFAPGVGTPVRGGINWRESNVLMENVADSGRMTSCEITELNPILDVRNQSAEVAVDLVASAFGKSIL